MAVEGLVAQGIGVATLPRMAVESFPLLPGVAIVPLPAGALRRIHTVTARGADRVPAVRATLDALARLIERGTDEPASAASARPAAPTGASAAD